MDLFKTAETNNTIARSNYTVSMLEYFAKVGSDTPASGDDIGWLRRAELMEASA